MQRPRRLPQPLRNLAAAVAAPPAWALGAGMTLGWRQVLSRHPRILDRFRGLNGQSIRIDANELPFSIVFRPGPSSPEVRVVRRSAKSGAAASIRGSLATLVDLLEGREDGDALFFSRRLEVEGDMSAVVALRNGLEAEQIDLFVDAAPPGATGFAEAVTSLVHRLASKWTRP